MNLLRFKNGVSFEDPTPAIAASVKELHKNNKPRAISMNEVPGIKGWLDSRERAIRENENLAISLAFDIGHYETKLETILESLKVLEKMARGSARDAQIQKGENLQRSYELEIEGLRRRITKAKALAAQTKDIVAEFYKENPSWPKALADYKVLDRVPSLV
jgi:hypothetical protein